MWRGSFPFLDFRIKCTFPSQHNIDDIAQSGTKEPLSWKAKAGKAFLKIKSADQTLKPENLLDPHSRDMQLEAMELHPRMHNIHI